MRKGEKTNEFFLIRAAACVSRISLRALWVLIRAHNKRTADTHSSSARFGYLYFARTQPEERERKPCAEDVQASAPRRKRSRIKRNPGNVRASGEKIPLRRLASFSRGRLRIPFVHVFRLCRNYYHCFFFFHSIITFSVYFTHSQQ